MLELYFFNVGHGDSIAIKFPNNTWGVIDCNRNTNETTPHVLTFLLNKKVGNLCFLCITHPHEDHFKGIDKIIEQYSKHIDKLILYGLTRNDKEILETSSLGKGLKYFYNDNKTNIRDKIELANINHSINVGDVEIKILNPTDDDLKNVMLKECFASSVEYNAVSVVLFLEYKKCKILLTGDSTDYNWKRIFKLNAFEHLADIIKISHHGSIENNSGELLEKLMNKNAYSIISSDGGFKYKTIPSNDVIHFLEEKLQSKVLQTSLVNHNKRQVVEKTPFYSSNIEEAVVDTITGDSYFGNHYDGYIKICIDDNGNITHSYFDSIYN